MKHTPGPINLYYHKTSGGAEYLTDKFTVCLNGHREGIFDGAEYIVRLDGSPELSVQNRQLKEAAPDLLEACRDMLHNHFYVMKNDEGCDGFDNIIVQLETVIHKATE